MKRRVIAMAWAVVAGGVVMLLAGFVHPVFGYVAGVVCAEAVYLWQVVRSERLPPPTDQVPMGTK